MAPLLLDQPGVAELGEVERQGGIGNAQRLGDRARREAVGAGLDQQPEHRQPMFLRERTKRGDGTAEVFVSMKFEMTVCGRDVNDNSTFYRNEPVRDLPGMRSRC